MGFRIGPEAEDREAVEQGDGREPLACRENIVDCRRWYFIYSGLCIPRGLPNWYTARSLEEEELVPSGEYAIG